MGESSIEWTDRTWTPVVGCDPVSPACANCYAAMMASRLATMEKTRAKYEGLAVRAGGTARWTGVVRCDEAALMEPLKHKKPTRYFVTSMGDLFHKDVPDAFLDRVFAIMALCPQHTFMVLTKRAERMRDYCRSLGRHHEIDRVSLAMKRVHAETGCGGNGAWYTFGDVGWHFKNIWLGVTAEDQATADERIPHLLATPAARRFVSCEPLLGPVDLTHIPGRTVEHDGITEHWADALTGAFGDADNGIVEGVGPRLDLVIVGGESGPKARPMHPDWARGLRDQCKAAGTAFFFKQWGEWAPEALAMRECWQPNQWHEWGNAAAIRVGKKAAGRLLDGRVHDELPGGEHA